MRFLQGSACALAMLLATVYSGPAVAYEVFATSYFTPESGDPNPGLTGVMKIDTETGAATTFIPESAGGLLNPTDIVLNPTTNTLYVSAQDGRIWHYDAVTGAPLDSLVAGEPAGVFALLPTAGFSDGVNSLLLQGDDTLLAATAFGSITPYSLATGAQGADLASGLAFPSALDAAPSGALIVSTGDPFGGPGAIISIDDGATTTIVDYTDSPGVLGASNPTVVLPAADYDANGVVDAQDYDVWAAAYSTDDPAADGNFDGVVDAADYTLWRDTRGETARIVVADLNGNQLVGFDLDGENGAQLAVIPPAIPDPLPETANPLAPSNSPSEVLVTTDGTLLVSTLGLTRRPDNRGALLEFSRDGSLLRTIADGLPPISGIAFVPAAINQIAVPEPAAALLAMVGGLATLTRRRL